MTQNVDRWTLSGNCTFRGGQLCGVGVEGGSIVIAPDSRLRVEGTHFMSLVIMVEKSDLVVEDAWFYPSGMNTIAGIRAVASRVLVARSFFTDLSGERGAALFLRGGELTVQDCGFDRLEAHTSGGAIYAEEARVSVSGSSFQGLSLVPGTSQSAVPLGGGAIAVNRSEIKLRACTFESICSIRMGGAVFATGRDSTVTILDSGFRNMRVASICRIRGQEETVARSGYGGTVAMDGGKLIMHNVTVEMSTAMIRGGAIWAKQATIEASRLTMENLEAEKGGGFYLTEGSLSISGGTAISGARASGRGKDIDMRKEGISHGGLVFAEGTRVRVTGAKLSDMRAEGDGGAFYLSGGQLTIVDVEARNSESSDLGGLVYASDLYLGIGAAELQMSVTNLSARIAKANAGGGFYITAMNSYSTVTLKHVTLANTKARGGDGGALFVANCWHILMETVSITDSHASGSGGAIQLSHVDRATMKDLKMSSTRSSEPGGAIDFSGGTYAHLERLDVYSARAKRGGALMISEFSHVEARDVRLVKTASRMGGGAVRITQRSSLKCSGLRVEVARAKNQGGALYVHDGSTVELEQVYIEGAEAPLGGAYIFALASTVSVVGASFKPEQSFGAKLFAFSRSRVSFTDVNITTPLLGRFAAWESSEFALQGFTAECALHAEFRNLSTAYLCEECNWNEGILGISPVSADGAECYMCPPNSEGCNDKGCLCKPDYVLNNTEPGDPVAGFNSKCASCSGSNILCPAVRCGDDQSPFVLNCPKGSQQCRQVWAMPGHWRLDDSWAAAVPCTFGPACNRTEQGMCKEGYEGVMCMVCEKGRFRQSRFRECRPCNVSVANEFLFYSAPLLGILVVIVGLMHLEKVREFFVDVTDAIHDRTSYVRVKAKQVAFIVQASSTLTELRFPANGAANAAGSMAPWVSLDVFASRHITRCRFGMDAYQAYLFSLAQLVPMLLAILFLSKKLKVEVDWLVLTFYNFMLMNIVKESLSIFLCDDSAWPVTGKSYLYGDYSLACSDAKHVSVCCLASLVLFVWCIGIPGFLWCRMYKRRHQLNPRIKAPICPADCAAGEQVMAVFTQMAREYNEAVRCYGLSTMLHLTREHKKLVDSRSAQLSWSRERAPSTDDVTRIRTTSVGSTSMRLDTRKLLKQGLRAAEERKNPKLKAYRNFYRHYNCERWYYEFIGIWGRVGYALVMMLPASLQCLAGLLLSGLLLLLLCILMPYKRRSDNYVGAACYVAMLGLFGAHTVHEHTYGLKFISGLCCALPILCLSWYVLRAYALPGRDAIWTAERADQIFDEEFARMRLAPRARRQQQGVELASLQKAGLLKKFKDQYLDEREDPGTTAGGIGGAA